MAVKVAINGFGRIGRNVLRAIAESGRKDIQVVAYGEQRMLEISRALLMDPKLIMLDEPSIGLAPRMVDTVFHAVGILKAQGKAILMVEQNVKKALAASDRAYVMELGEIRLEDAAPALIDDPRVARLYMGKR